MTPKIDIPPFLRQRLGSLGVIISIIIIIINYCHHYYNSLLNQEEDSWFKINNTDLKTLISF